MDCKTGRALKDQLDSLTSEQLDYPMWITVSEDVESGNVHVFVDDRAKRIEVVGSSEDL